MGNMLPPIPQWENLVSYDLPVKVKWNPWTGKVDDIELRIDGGQQRPPIHPDMHIFRKVDRYNNLEYIMHLDADEHVFALSPVTKQYLQIIRNQNGDGTKKNPLRMKPIIRKRENLHENKRQFP